jgi:hypothetical protein
MNILYPCLVAALALAAPVFAQGESIPLPSVPAPQVESPTEPAAAQEPIVKESPLPDPGADAAASEEAPAAPAPRVLRHTVLFRYKPAVSAAQKQEVIQRFAALKDAIPLILRFEGGDNVEGEGLGDGFEHVFCATFADIAARDAYLPHPAHQEFVAFVGPLLDKVIVGDFWAPAEQGAG